MVIANEKIKLMPKLDRAKVIAGVGLLSGLILLIYGLMMTRIVYNGESVFYRYIHGIVTLIWASMAITSSILLLRGNKIGYIILLLGGIGSLVGTFIPIFSYDPYGYGYITTVYLSGTAGYFDLVLMLLGGIYGVALMGKDEREE